MEKHATRCACHLKKGTSAHKCGRKDAGERNMVWRFLKKLNRELPQGRAIPLVGVYPKPLRTGTQTNPCARVLTVAN